MLSRIVSGWRFLMGKRSNFDRVPRDYYPTPMEAVIPLLPHLDERTRFDEPCAGDGRLIHHLEHHDHECIECSDIEPRAAFIAEEDVFNIEYCAGECFITNPPWDRKILHPLIDHLAGMVPTWLLFDADWMHTKQAADYLSYCVKIVSVGRVKWIEDSKMTGKDNCCWYLFDGAWSGRTEFYGRNG